jgi:2-C-methyl-D-erythritol 4-phosphate cytidylyltransferase / 2-C-methyl-D-erythritol 2,4-cyclodiphosphate synthase
MRSLLPNHSVTVIIPAGGSGERLGASIPKALVSLAGRTLIEHCVSNVAPIANQIIVAAPAGYEDQFRSLLGDDILVVTGGVVRADSVRAALQHATSDFILVHDAARSLASPELAGRIIDALASGEKAVIPVMAVIDTIKHVDHNDFVIATHDRSSLRAVQTPQGFDASTLKAAHATSQDATDDAGLVEALNIPVKIVEGEERAFKITLPEDLLRAEKLLIGEDSKHIRVGIGTDAHAFSTDSQRQMWLAGLLWSDEIGVDGHSDGDVAAHAVCDALFSAAQLGDLGSNFGVSEPEWAGASGAKLLQETLTRVRAAGYEINNVSVQIVGNRPKIGPRRAEAIAALSTALDGAPVSLSATTTDGLGFTGEGKGISAIASVLLRATDRIS